MTGRAGWTACVLMLWPAAIPAQSLTGLAEVTAGTGSSTSGGQAQSNDSLWQGYTVGLASPFLSPKLLKLNAEVSFRAGALSFAGPAPDQRGTHRALGYKLGATLFPAGQFPLTIQTLRDNVAESGEYPSSDGIRAGVVVPPGQPTPDFRTRHTSLSVGWQLMTPTLPHVEVGYRKGGATVTGGPYSGTQRDDELRLGVTKDTRRTRHALRYQRNAYDGVSSLGFNQRFGDLDYELGATLTPRLRMSTRVGRRTQESMFGVPASSGGVEAEAYHAPVRGAVDTAYTVGTVNFTPWPRLSLDGIGSFDRQRSIGASTDARLASGSARLDVVRGLSINAVGYYGRRGQFVARVPITVMTQSGLAGATYHAGLRWLHGSVGYSAGAGSNSTPEGRTAAMRSWSGQANLSVSIRHAGLSGGYEQSGNRDDILDFGNFVLERGHVAIQTQAGRFNVTGSAEQSRIDRGRGDTFSSTLQRTFSVSVSCRPGRDMQLTADAGGFTNDASFGQDRAMFGGVAYESQLLRALHLSAWIRYGDARQSLTQLDQATLYGFAQLEWRLRQFSLAVEYRRSAHRLVTSDLLAPYLFNGRNLQFRVSRKFFTRF
jgi:hypothetical protein